jgi:hypothetical protein
MSEQIGKDGFSLKAKFLARDAWYYETPGGFEVYWQPPGKSGQLICRIPWRSVLASVRRKERSKP